MNAVLIPPNPKTGAGWLIRVYGEEAPLPARVVHAGCAGELVVTDPNHKRWVANRPTEPAREQIRRDRASPEASAPATSNADDPWIEKKDSTGGKSFIRCPLCGSAYVAGAALAFVPIR